MIPVLETERLLLRGWLETDFEELAAMHADPRVMQFLGPVQERGDAWGSLAGMVGHWVLRGYGKWAVERKSDGALLGRVGLINPEGWPGIELGWTLGHAYWGQGYATEAAIAGLDYGFAALPVERILSCIDPANVASQNVAKRLGAIKGAHQVLRVGGKDHPADNWYVTRDAWLARRK